MSKRFENKIIGIITSQGCVLSKELEIGDCSTTHEDLWNNPYKSWRYCSSTGIVKSILWEGCLEYEEGLLIEDHLLKKYAIEI